MVISSSLHGIIAAEALGVPAVWMEMSDAVEGKGLKFYDYFLGSGRQRSDAVVLNWRNGISFTGIHPLPPPAFNVTAMLNAFPYPLRDGCIQDVLDSFQQFGVNAK